MKRFTSAALLFFLAVFAAGGAGAQDSGQEGVVQIYSFKFSNSGKFLGAGSGTGFVLNPEGYVATNRHVIDGGTSYRVIPDGDQIGITEAVEKPNAEVIWSSGDLDLAILKVEGLGRIRPVVLSTTLPKKGETVVAVGYPGASQDSDLKSEDLRADATVTSGVLSRSYEGTWGGGVPVGVVQHSAEVSWGNSGGPLMDSCGRVIGVNTQISLSGKAFIKTKDGYIEAAAQAPGVYFASNISELIETLDRRNIYYTLSKFRCKSRTEYLQNLLTWSVLGGAAAFVAMGGVLVVALRRPREQLVRVVSEYSRSFRSRRAGREPQYAPPERPAGTFRQEAASSAVCLEGRGLDGRSYCIELDRSELESRGAIIGREPDHPRNAVRDESVSRRHAFIRIWNGEVCIRDECSTNGTYVDGAKLKPGEERRFTGKSRITLGRVEFKARV